MASLPMKPLKSINSRICRGDNKKGSPNFLFLPLSWSQARTLLLLVIIYVWFPPYIPMRFSQPEISGSPKKEGYDVGDLLHHLSTANHQRSTQGATPAPPIGGWGRQKLSQLGSILGPAEFAKSLGLRQISCYG